MRHRVSTPYRSIYTFSEGNWTLQAYKSPIISNHLLKRYVDPGHDQDFQTPKRVTSEHQTPLPVTAPQPGSKSIGTTHTRPARLLRPSKPEDKERERSEKAEPRLEPVDTPSPGPQLDGARRRGVECGVE